MEITVKRTLNFWELLDNSWSGAKNVLEKVQEEGREEEAMQLIVEAFFDEVPDETAVNDFIWFELDDLMDLWTEEEDEEDDD